MFKILKEHKEAKKRQQDKDHFMEAARIQIAINKATKITDAGEKILKLEEILKDIEGVLNKEQEKIDDKGNASKEAVIMSSLSSSIALIGGGTAIVGIAPPVGIGMICMAVPTLIGGVAASFKRESHVVKKAEARVKNHTQRIESLKASAINIKNTTIKNNRNDIVHSSSYEKVLQVPDLAKEFEGAAAQQLEDYKKKVKAAREMTEAAKSENKPKSKLIKRN